MSQLRNAIIANLGGGTPPTPPAPLDDGKLRFTVNVNSTANIEYFSQYYEPSVSDYVIDWGDGSLSTATTTHTYASTGEYQIIISAGASNKFPLIKFNANQYIKSVDSVYPYVESTSGFTSLFTNSTLQSVCGKLFKNNSQITDIQSCFYGCTNLSTIPNDLCSYFTNVTRMTNFLRDTSIESLPQGLLDNCTNVTTLEYFCSGCSQLKTIPELLFNNNLKCDHFNFAFNGCTSLKLVKNLFCDETTGKTTRFSPMTGIGHIYFTSLFNRTSYTGSEVGEAPSLWEYTYGPTLHSNNCFAGAGNSTTSISNYNSIPSAWGGPAS